MWFRIYKGCDADIEMAITLQGECAEADTRVQFRGPLALESLAEEAVTAAISLDWSEAIERLRILRGIARNGIIYGGGYSPFQMLLLD